MQRTRIESYGVSVPRKSGFFRWGSFDHAVKAGEECLKTSTYKPRDVEILINAGIHKDRHIAEPAIAAILQDKLKINPQFQGRKSFSFDLLNGGCGMLNAAFIISNLIQSNSAHVGMVISSEANSDSRPDKNYAYPSSGAAMLLDVSASSNKGFGNFVFKSDEKYLDLYTSYIDISMKKGKLRLEKKQKELEDAYLSHANEVFDNALSREGLKREDISLVIPSQISKDFVSRLGSTLSFPKEKIVDITDVHDDTLTTSFLLAFHNAKQNGRIVPESKIVFLAFASGIALGAAIYYF